MLWQFGLVLKPTLWCQYTHLTIQVDVCPEGQSAFPPVGPNENARTTWCFYRPSRGAHMEYQNIYQDFFHRLLPMRWFPTHSFLKMSFLVVCRKRRTRRGPCSVGTGTLGSMSIETYWNRCWYEWPGLLQQEYPLIHAHSKCSNILISENNNHRGAEVNPHVVPFSLPFILAKRVSRFSGVTLGHEMELDEWMWGRE